MDATMRIAMVGHKRVPSREGGIEVVVEELAARMAVHGHAVTCYGSFMSLAHSMVTALWSLELLDEHQLRFFSSTQSDTRPSVPMP